MENQFVPHPIEEYLEREHIKDLPQDVKDEIRRIRSTYAFMPIEICQHLKERGVLKKVNKLHNKRSLWVNEDSGEVLYFDSFTGKFEVHAKFAE